MAPTKAELQLRFAFAHILSVQGFQPGLTGKTFLFGDLNHMIEGRIRSVGYDAGKPLKFYVTSPRYRGMDIKCIERRTYDAGDDKEEVRWCAVSPSYMFENQTADDGKNEKEGLFVLLD